MEMGPYLDGSYLKFVIIPNFHNIVLLQINHTCKEKDQIITKAWAYDLSKDSFQLVWFGDIDLKFRVYSFLNF
jgi:hypothetical protein